MDFLKKLGTAKIAMLISLVCAVLLGIGLLIFSVSRTHMSPIYSNLSLEDSNAIVAKLQLMGVPYVVEGEGSQITVPVDKIPALRMSFAQEGLPSVGSVVGYEIFDKSDSFGTSQFIYNVNLVRALEGELTRTISSLNAVESARVHLVIPKRELFSKASYTPSASIMLKLKNNQQITKLEIAAITHLISAAIPELKTGNITIIDTKGRALKLNTEDGDEYVLTGGMLDFKTSIEAKLVRAIEELLEKSVGVGKIKASVTADIDFDREVVNTEAYDPDGQVVRSHKLIEEKESDTRALNNVSVATNLPNATQSQVPGNSKNKSKSDEITNYEISKQVSNKVRESGTIKSLSIAVLVDGIYNTDHSSGKAVSIYQARSTEEMAQIRTLIASAVGIDEKRGDKLEVVNMQFISLLDEDGPPETFMDWIKHDLKGLIQTGIIAIVGVLSLILVVRPLVMRLLEMRRNEKGASGVDDLDSLMTGLELSPQAAGDMNNMNTETFAPDLANSFSGAMASGEDGLVGQQRKTENSTLEELLSGKGRQKQQNLAKYLNEIVDQHSEEAVSIVRNWLYQSE